MIKILQDWLEIGESNKFLNKRRLPKHSTPEKNWDLYQLYKIVELLPKDIKIIDLGCGGICTLKFLHAMGFKNLYGIDLKITLKGRLSQASRMFTSKSLRPPFYLYRGDLTKTAFPNDFFDIAVCTSVIEHGINFENFLIEVHRVLKSHGVLFIITDYWENKVNVNKETKPFGMVWKIFCKKDIQDFQSLLSKYGFSAYKDTFIPNCYDKCVVWNNTEYTFINLVYKKP